MNDLVAYTAPFLFLHSCVDSLVTPFATNRVTLGVYTESGDIIATEFERRPVAVSSGSFVKILHAALVAEARQTGIAKSAFPEIESLKAACSQILSLFNSKQSGERLPDWLWIGTDTVKKKRKMNSEQRTA